MRFLLLYILVAVAIAPPITVCSADNTAAKAKQQVTTAIETRRRTQQAEDQWEEQRVRLEAEYQELEEANRQLSEENRVLQERVDAARRSVADMRSEILSLQQVSEKLSPYLQQVWSRLKAGVDESLPFDMPQRRRRVARIGQKLAQEDLSIGVRFRELTDALLVEARYGNSVDVGTRQIPLEGQPVMVRVLRLGRLGLFYLTLDHKSAGTWDPAASAWKALPEAYTEEVVKAFQIGSRQRSVELLTLPLGRIAAP